MASWWVSSGEAAHGNRGSECGVLRLPIGLPRLSTQPKTSKTVILFIKYFHGYLPVEKLSASISHSRVEGLVGPTVGTTVLHGTSSHWSKIENLAVPGHELSSFGATQCNERAMIMFKVQQGEERF